MNFSLLADCCQKWRDILVLGRTIERDGKQYHIIGMTLADEAKLYLLEPNCASTSAQTSPKRSHTRRKMMKQHDEHNLCYLDCSAFCFGNQKLTVQGGSGGCLAYELHNYGVIQLFCDMIGAGWEIPTWLQHVEWNDLQLVTLNLGNLKKLPRVTSETPILIKHRPDPKIHIIEKTVTLRVGQKRSFCFTDAHGDKVRCYINRVSVMDVWRTMEEQFALPKYTKRVPPEQLQKMKCHCFEVLGQSCPKGMCYFAVEYECSKEMGLQFYAKQFLQSSPGQGAGNGASMGMILKPDEKTGEHNLSLRSCVIQTAVSPDTSEMVAELFSGYEKVDEWEERVIVL